MGLDIGQTSAKAVLLKRNGRRIVIADAAFIDTRMEGLLNEQELFQAMASWLNRQKLLQTPACCGLPQYLTTEAIFDFPPERHSGELQKMVDFQTKQLGGMSDEAFIYDYQSLPPVGNQINPVLIALCRQSALNAHIANYRAINVHVDEIVNQGLALFNAFVDLHPLEAEEPSLQALLEIGHEESTFALIYGGTLLHVCGIAFGANRFTQAIATDRQCDFAEAERLKFNVQPDWQSHDSDFSQAIRQLKNEITVTFSHWKDQAKLDLPAWELTKVWMTGGGVLQPGLEDALTAAMDCGIEFFGVPSTLFTTPSLPFPPGFSFHPNLTIAYGLALQELNAGKIELSLIPEDMSWQRTKMANFPFLLAGCLGVIISILWILQLCLTHIKSNQLILTDNQQELNLCLDIIPKLEEAYSQLDLYQKKLIPITEMAYRSERFIETMDVWQATIRDTASPEDNWCIYLADPFSFERSNSVNAKGASSSSATKPSTSSTTGTARPATASTARATATESTTPRITDTVSATAPAGADRENTAALPPPVPLTLVTSIPQMRSIFAGGIVKREESRYKVIKDIMTRLKDNEVFVNADDFTDFINLEFNAKFLTPWETFLRENRSKINQEYTLFFLQMPFREEILHFPQQDSSTTQPEPAGNTGPAADSSTGN